MPNFNGKGPQGAGPGTGWGKGPCGQGRGFGRGWAALSKDEQLKMLQAEKQAIDEDIASLKGKE